jgi:hypothetical protein
MLDKNGVLDRYFIECRCMLLELAATLDRYDRAGGAAAPKDDRLPLMQQAVQLLGRPSERPDRAERMLKMLTGGTD